MWKIVTAIPKEQQAIIVLLESPEGNTKAEKAVSELTGTDVNNENGMELLIEKLDKVSESDKIDETYLVYSRFINFHKSDEMSMTDYTIYWTFVSQDGQLWNAITKYSINFQIIGWCKTQGGWKKTTIDFKNLEFETIKSAFKRIFTKSTKANKSFHDTNNIKQEEAFYTKNIYRLKQNKASISSKFQKVLNSNKHNPLYKNGKVSRCVVCDSKMHWADKCPHKSNYQSFNISEEITSDTENESESEKINIVLMTEKIDKNEIFIAEASKLAVVDTACTKIVAVQEWYMNYIKDIPCELKCQIKSVESNT